MWDGSFPLEAPGGGEDDGQWGDMEKDLEVNFREMRRVD